MTRNSIILLASVLTLTDLVLPQQADRLLPLESVNPRVRTLASEGPVEDSMTVAGLAMRFRLTEKQEAALEQLLEEQRNPASPLYHVWLTPEEYAERFGISANDLARV